MGKSEDLLAAGIKQEMRGRFVALLDFLERYKTDERLYNDEVLILDSELGKALDKAHALAALRKQYATVLPTATAAQMAKALNELTTEAAPAEPTA